MRWWRGAMMTQSLVSMTNGSGELTHPCGTPLQVVTRGECDVNAEQLLSVDEEGVIPVNEI